MRRAALYRLSDGLVLGCLQGDMLPAPDEGTALLDIEADVDPRGMCVEAGELVPAPADLGQLRAAKWAAVRAYRDVAEWRGCLTPLGRVDTDPDSQRKIAGSSQMAMIAKIAAEPFTVNWTMADNSVVEHDAEAMIAMGVAAGLHVGACHAVALMKRAQIDAAQDEAAIDAVEITTGWPA